MAAKTLEEVLASLSGDQRKLFESTLSENPELKDGWLRQDDYSRKMTEVSAKQKEYDQIQAEAEEIRQGWEKASKVWDGLVEKGIVDGKTYEETWTTQKAELEAQLAAARNAAVAGEDMKPEELEAKVREIVKAAGGASQEEMKALMEQEMRKAATATFADEWKKREEEFNTKTIPFVGGFSAAAAIVANHYEQETGEKWNAEKQQQLYKLMAEENNFDAFAVEEKLLKPFRDKRAQEEEVKRRVEEATRKVRAEQGGSEDSIPNDERAKGALRMMMERSAGEGDFESMIAQKAREGAAELRTSGKA